MKRIFLNPANRYLCLLCLYNILGLFFLDGGSSVGQLLCFIIIGIGIKNLYSVLIGTYSKAIRGITVLLFFFSIYGIIRLLLGQVIVVDGEFELSPLQTFKTILLSILPIYSFYYYSIKGWCDENFIQKWILPLLVVAVANYSIFSSIAHLSHEGQDGVTNNASYFFIALLPSIVFLKNKPLLQYLYISVLLLFVILCMKRGAILTGIVLMIYFFKYSLKDATGKAKIVVCLVIIAIVLFASYFVAYMMSTSNYFMFRVQQTMEGNASNREDMYPFFWKVFTESSGFIQLFGGGIDYSVIVSGNGAHNDWFEILLSQGLFGVILYIGYWINLIKIRKKLFYNRMLFVAFTLIILSEFIKTFFSFSINALPFYEMPVWGYCIYKANCLTNKV